MKAKRIFALLTAILMLTCCMAISVSAGETFQDEYLSLQVPDNYTKDDINMTGTLTKGAYYEVDANGEETGDNFNFYILQNNITRMTLKTMQKEEMRQELKQQIVDTVKNEGAASRLFYTIREVTDGFEIAEHFSYYKVSLSASVTYRGSSAPMYQVLVLVPINDCTFYFTYTSMESLEKAESECAAILDNLQILIEPQTNPFLIALCVAAVILILVIVAVTVTVSKNKKKKQAAAQQQAAYPYPYPTAPNGQYPANGQYPPYAPQGQPQNPQQPAQAPQDSNDTQNPQ